MNSQIIVISDIHASAVNQNAIKEKILMLENLVGSKSITIDNLFIACVGDIASSGLESEYNIIIGLLEQLKEKIKNHYPSLNVHFLCVPGNHDANWEEGKETCRIVREKNTLNEYITFSSVFQKRFDNYVSFQEKLTKDANEEVVRVKDFKTQGDISLRFVLINSAIYSGEKIDKGHLIFPSQLLQNEKEGQGKALRIGLMHHSLEWFDKKIQREVEKALLPEIDLLITGHDHSSSYMCKENSASSYMHVETDAMDDFDNKENNGVISIYIDCQNERKAHINSYRYFWNNDKYIDKDENEDKEIELKEVNQSFALSKEFVSKLEQVSCGVDISGEQLFMDDVFVYPYLQYEKDNKPRKKTVSAEDLIKSGELCNHIIYGDHNSGKTMLLHRFFTDLFHAGKVPLLIDYSEIKYDSIEKIIQKSYIEQYRKRKYDDYLSLPNDRMALLIDNFNPSIKNIDRRIREISEIKRRIPVLIIMIDSDYGVNCSRNSSFHEIVEGGFMVYRISQMNRKARHELVAKWMCMKNSCRDESGIRSEIIDVENNLTRLLGDSLIPRYPLYISMFLKATMFADRLDESKIGTCGSLYELLIKQELYNLECLNLQDYVNYLSEMAHYMHKHTIDPFSFSKADYNKFAQYFNDEYEMKLNSDAIYRELVNQKIFAEQIDGTVKFSKDYFYYYFMAFYLEKNAEKAEVADEIRSLCVNLFDKSQASIWMFLTHISHKSVIVDTLTTYAKSLLINIPEIKFEDDIDFVEHLKRKELNVKFNDDKYELLQDRRYEAEDKSDAEVSSITESIAETEYDLNDPVVQLVQAGKAIEALGQLLRNFTASLKADTKQLLLETTYKLTLRCINFVLRGIIDSAPNFIRLFISKDRSVTDNQSYKDAVDKYATRIYYLLVFYSSLTLEKSAIAISSKDLTLSYDNAMRRLENSNSLNLFFYTLKLLTTKNPQNFIPNHLIPRINKKIYCREMLKVIMFNYIYLYVDNSRQKQSLCAKYNIPYSLLISKSSDA